MNKSRQKAVRNRRRNRCNRIIKNMLDLFHRIIKHIPCAVAGLIKERQWSRRFSCAAFTLGQHVLAECLHSRLCPNGATALVAMKHDHHSCIELLSHTRDHTFINTNLE